MLGHLAAATDIYVRLNGDPFTSPHYIFSLSSGGDSEQVTLVKGSAYTFIRTDDGHAFNVGDGWRQENTQVTVSNTGTGGVVGGAASIVNGEQLTVAIPSTFSGNTLKYFCYAHASMIGTFNVVPATGDTGCDNLVTDGTFDETTSTTWSGNAYNPVGGVNQANVNAAGNPWDVNLQQSVTLVSGADYTLSFDVSGDDRTMVAGIGQTSGTYLNHVYTVTLSAETQRIVMHLSAKSDGVGQVFGGENMRVFFDMGADTGAVNIDNVALTCGHTDTENLGDFGDTGNGDTDYSLPGEYSTVDSIKWFHQTQLPSGGSWFNGELQHYTGEDANSYVSDGTLKIVAKKEDYTHQGVTKQYTSARLNSKFAFTYGVVEVRAKLPTGRGTWPAIWTLGKNIAEDGAYWQIQGLGTTAWPACGEIDIMEHWGSNQNFVQSALHTPSSYGGTINHGGQSIDTVSTQFHTYSMDWDAERIIFAVDGGVHYTYNPTVKNDQNWPFDAEQYLLLNVAIESVISDSFVESAMEIDYVRVFQKIGDDYEIVWRDEFGDQEDTVTPWDVSDGSVDVDQLQRDCASGTSASCSALLLQCTC